MVHEGSGEPIAKAVFCGHFHNNVVGHFAHGTIEHIITSSVGRQLARAECGEPAVSILESVHAD